MFNKNTNYVLKVANAKKLKYKDTFKKKVALFEVNMTKQLLSTIIGQTKQQNSIFDRYDIVQFLSSVFTQEETLVLNCLYNAPGYPKQIINSMINIFRRTT